ncbi:aminodeoxychorismate synthase component I [Marinilongibacter aquaticus]|uniref:aminodeoxychorismate synthase component I n=1 Tax=Marinilongibacter aquaticus TaxID=2975157 RepID=UPI0021BCFFB3|nr:aminodeoxychorismate synthase component I [Marinilongibacter aquaticus]UBM60322.1 aminodeoxychorismate synthase component I [Marinilongibacter aquaticus]
MHLSEEFISQMNQLGRERTAFLFLIDYEMEKPLIRKLEDLSPEEFEFEVDDGFLALDNHVRSKPKELETLQIATDPISFERYRNAFDFVKGNILFGNSFLANLTVETPIELNWSLDDLYRFSKAKYKLHFKDRFLCFSPETFVQIDGEGKIASFPMKGTIELNEQAAYQQILGDAKELYEHTTIVDLIRNDLSKVAQKVWVERFRFVDEIQRQGRPPLLQVSSEICGQLESRWPEQIGDIFNAMLPAGSITGAPKPKTTEIISTAEKTTYLEKKRGYYSGVFGVFDGQCLSSSVLIRFIENRQGNLFFKSGGGITSRSSAEKEYQEVLSKIYVPLF